MSVTFTLDAIFEIVGTVVCVILPSLIALGIYANFKIVRRGDDDQVGKGEKWKP